MIDFNLNEGDPVLLDDADLVLQQIDMLFDTHKNEVLGEPYYGTNYSEFLYNMQLDNNDIKYRIQSDIQSIDLLGFNCDVDVSLLEGSMNDIILVQIHLQRQDEYYNKAYKITN